jgi:hypothetical protein
MQRTVLYDVQDAKVYPFTADEAGSNPTYGTALDVPGIQQVALAPQYESAQLNGDGRELDTRSRLKAAELSFRYAKLDPAVLAVLDGGTVSTTGTGGTAVTSYLRSADDRIPYFGFAAEVVEVDNPEGSAVLAVFKCRITDGSLFSGETDDYGVPEFTARAVFTERGFLWRADLRADSPGVPTDLATLLPAVS